MDMLLLRVRVLIPDCDLSMAGIAVGVQEQPAMLALTVRVVGPEQIAITSDVVAAAESFPAAT